MEALTAYEQRFGVRQVDAYDWTRPAVGLQYATFAAPSTAPPSRSPPPAATTPSGT
jgi:hypothetical protein